MGNDMEKIREKKKQWVEGRLNPALKRFNLKQSPTEYYTPEDTGDFNFLEKVGFPGEYPFTAGTYPTHPYAGGTRGGGMIQSAPGLRSAWHITCWSTTVTVVASSPRSLPWPWSRWETAATAGP